MKHIICLLLFYCCLRAAAAQDTLRILSEHGWDPTLTEIDIRELPEAIKQKVSSGQYSSWIVQAAYTTPALGGIATTRNSDSVDYIVELKKEDEVIRVRFDDAGNKREENNPD